MTDGAVPNEPPPGDSSFEADMRRQSGLMRSMASRKSWERESRWAFQGRKLAVGVLYFAAVVAMVLILWMASSLFLSS